MNITVSQLQDGTLTVTTGSVEITKPNNPVVESKSFTVHEDMGREYFKNPEHFHLDMNKGFIKKGGN